jgi:hypothetical protein
MAAQSRPKAIELTHPVRRQPLLLVRISDAVLADGALDGSLFTLRHGSLSGEWIEVARRGP